MYGEISGAIFSISKFNALNVQMEFKPYLVLAFYTNKYMYSTQITNDQMTCIFKCAMGSRGRLSNKFQSGAKRHNLMFTQHIWIMELMGGR